MPPADSLQHAIAVHQSGNLAEAEKLYRGVLDAEPGRADARYNLGLVYGQLGRPFEAVREISQALQSKPDFGQGWFMLCEFADAIGQADLNLFAGEQAVRLMPDHARAWLRYGLALSRNGRDEDALEAYRRAVAFDPSLIKGWVNLCVTSKLLGDYVAAEEFIRKAFHHAKVAIPDESACEADENEYNYLFWHLALLELITGRYREGFAHFRARYKGGTDWKRFESDKPLWRGEDLRGKTILITVEQGFGDALMMGRYLHWLKADGARVIFQAHPALVPLFKNWPGADEIIPYGEPVASAYDFHAAIFDLPHRFGTTLETVSASAPYLPMLMQDEDTELPEGDGPRIGVIWAGQSGNARDANRSIPLEVFAGLFSVRECQFFSLTRDKRPGEAELLKQYPVTDLAPLLTDFSVSARLIGQMDLVISVDTAAVHLAGGMGKNVWTLLPFAPDWRWALEREDNVWYPTMRLFRRGKGDGWRDVIRRVKKELSAISS